MTNELTPILLGGKWAITEEGFETLKSTATLAKDLKLSREAFDSDDGPSLLTRHGSSGIIRIAGPTVSRGSWITRLFGIASYTDIQQALLQAVEDPEIDRIILDIDSPGGAVHGVDATGEMIKAIDQTVKPVFAVTDGTMCSAAYWLGSSAREIYASRTSIVGSIGVAMTHMETSKHNEERGLTVTVFRSGKYKQLGNSYESLTDEARLEIQTTLDAVYKIFVGEVAEARGKSYSFTDQYMAQGREFMAEKAKEVGLVDQIMSFQAALVDISSKTVDSTRFPYKIGS